MADPLQFNADQLAFWNGPGGRAWVARQHHIDNMLAPVMAALLDLAAAKTGEAVLDIGCGCGAATLDIARAVGPTGRVTALDISAPMLAEARARAAATGITNVDWQEADAATTMLRGYDLLISSFGVMFFGDPVAAFTNLHRAARPGARMAFVCWRPLGENSWIEVPVNAIAPHLPPRPSPDPTAPGMFALADPGRVDRILTQAGWAAPRMKMLDLDLDLAAGQGLEAAVAQSAGIGLLNSWMRDQPDAVVAAATASLRATLSTYLDGASLRLPAAMWLVSSTPA